jgi:NAD(P)-dependent dehydrogenase (short-subunit alcohol dehydrogenase family)
VWEHDPPAVYGCCAWRYTHRTREYDAAHYRLSAFYGLAESTVVRLTFAQSTELAPHGCAAVALSPGWMRSEMMLAGLPADPRRYC